MCCKENDKEQNYLHEKFLKSKFAKKNDNYTRTFKPLKANRNPQVFFEPYKIRFLLIYFIVMIKIEVAISFRNKKLNELNEITIKIIGTGEQSILSSTFSPQPSKILVNGESTNINLENKINILEGDINNITMKWNDKINSSQGMFEGLTNLKEVDLSNFDGSEVSSMRFMFMSCTNLESVNFNNIKTPYLDNMALLFYDCKSLLSVDLSPLNTSSVTNMGSMFKGCTSLTSVNLNNLDTSKVKEMEYLFSSCTSLTSVDLSKFDTSSVTNMASMFYNCLSLTSLDLSKFITNSLTMVNGLFSGCKNLSYINMQNFDVSKTASLFSLFKGCQNLEYINLNNFIEGNKITNIQYFFDEVPNNITYCINNEDNAPLISKELNNRTCTINDCSDDWNTKQKLEIIEKNICVYNCSEDKQYKYQFENRCYEDCPNGSILSSDNKCEIQRKGDKSDIYTNSYTESLPHKYTNINKITEAISNKNTNINEITESLSNKYSNIKENIESLSNKYINISENSDNDIPQITDIKSYSSECLFIEIKSKDCYNQVTLKDLLDKNYSPLNTKKSINRVYELFSLEFNNKNRNINISKDEIIEGENVIFQITTTQKQDYYLKNNIFNNISSIDLGKCEKILQKEYKINEPLIIIKVDIKRDDTVSTQVEYEVYNPYNLQKLNLSYCAITKIDIYPPINLDKETIDLAKHLKKQGYDLFDSYDDFYNDICSPFNSYNDTDVILNDRKNDFYISNITLCEENCKYEEFLIEPLKAKCNCDIKTEVKSEVSKVKFYPNKIIENFYEIESYANIKVVICYEEVFNLERLKKNYGSCFMIIIGVLFIIIMSLLFISINNKIVKIIQKLFIQYKHMIVHLNQIEKNKSKNNKPNKIGNKKNINLKEKSRKNNKTVKKNNNIKLKIKSNPSKKIKKDLIKKNNKLPKRRTSNNYCNSNNVSNSFRNLNSSVKSLPKKITKKIININGIFIFPNQNFKYNYNSQFLVNKKNKIIVNEKKNKNNDTFIDKIIYLISKSKRYKYFSDEELNSLNYEHALEIDFRSYFKFYYCLLKETHLIIFTFFVRNDYNIFLLKLSLFIISFALFLFMNTLFFSDDSMHKIYEDEGKYDFLYQIPQTLYSTIVSQIISSLLENLSLSNDDVISLKEKENCNEMKQELIKIIKCIKIKCIIFFVVGIILLFGFWYYISAFCVVYYNTQIPLIKDSFTSFLTSMVYPFLLDLLPGIFRIISLRFKIKCLFITSKIITKIIGIL